jgi:hypothetical protein
MTVARDASGVAASEPAAVDGGTRWTLYVVPGSHFDLGWCASPAECLAYSDEIIRHAVDAIAGPYPSYRFTVEYAAFFAHFLERYPEYRPLVRRLVREGALDVCAGMTGLMEPVLDGETLVRQIVDARRWARDTLGYDPPVAQHTDIMGHTPQMPQILARCGVKYLSYSRYRPPVPVHWWEAPDGSRVLAANHPHHYGWAHILRRGEAREKLPGQLAELEQMWPVETIGRIGLMLGESDLRFSNPPDVDTVKELEAEGYARFNFATITGFFEAIGPQAGGLPIFRGEAPYSNYAIPAHQAGVYETARRAEQALLAAEKLSAWRELLGLGRGPWPAIVDAWQWLYIPHDHNATGRHLQPNLELRRHAPKHALMQAQQVLQEAMTQLATHVRYHAPPAAREAYGASGEPPAIVVANALSWPRAGALEGFMNFRGSDVTGARVFDAEGNEHPAQTVKVEQAGTERPDFARSDRSRVWFVCETPVVPAHGYATLYLAPQRHPPGYPDTGGALTRRLPPVDGAYRTAAWEVEVRSGRLRGLRWRDGRGLPGATEDGLDLTSHPGLTGPPGLPGSAGGSRHGFAELISLEDTRGSTENTIDEQYGRSGVNFTGREWTTAEHPAQLTLVEQGPVFTRLVCDGQVEGAPVRWDWRLYDRPAQVDLTITLDWPGIKNRQVRLALPLHVPGGDWGVAAARATGAVALGMGADRPGWRIAQGGSDSPATPVLSSDAGQAAPSAVEVTYETPYGHVVYGRDEIPNTFRGDGVRWTQKWIDVSSAALGYGVTVATMHAAHAIHAGALYPLLLRSVYSGGDPFEWILNEGRHEFRFRFTPHRGSWQEALTFRTGWELCSPLLSGQLATAEPLAPIPGQDTLPQEAGFLGVDAANVIVTTMHPYVRPDAGQDATLAGAGPAGATPAGATPAGAGSAGVPGAGTVSPRGEWVIRLYEVAGRAATATLSFAVPVEHAWRTDLLGDGGDPLPVRRAGDASMIDVALAGHEIAALRVACAPPAGAARAPTAPTFGQAG